EHFADLEQHRHCQWAHVVLDLVQVTGRDIELLGEHHLAQAALGAQLAQSRAHIGLGHSSSLKGISQPCQGEINTVVTGAVAGHGYRESVLFADVVRTSAAVRSTRSRKAKIAALAELLRAAAPEE